MLYIKGECYCQYYFTSLFILFISYFDVVLYAQTFVIVYSHTYSTQSLNIALLSCLLRTLGIVLYCILNILSCLLRTLAVWYRVLASRNLAVTFCTLSHTCLVTVEDKQAMGYVTRRVWESVQNVTARLREAKTRYQTARVRSKQLRSAIFGLWVEYVCE